MMIPRSGTALSIVAILAFLPAAPALVQDEAPPATQLTLPDSPSVALEMREDLDDVLEGLERGDLEELLAAWMQTAREQAALLERALQAPEGTPERARVVALQSELDTILAGAETIAEAAAGAGADVAPTRDDIADMRPDQAADLEASTVPPNRQQALELPVEVLKAQLRPLRREQASAQLEQWLEFLQTTCLEVRNAEISALQTEDPRKVEELSSRAVTLRGERSGLIKRVDAVIAALERKGGDVEEAREYVASVVVKPPITGWHAAWATVRAWLTDKEGGIARAKSIGTAALILIAFWFLARILTGIVRRATRSLPRASQLLQEFITSSARRLTILIGLLIALSTLGVNMTPLVAAIGAAGLVIGLALQGTLGNLASGLMIMVYRPFDVGDAVNVAGIAGKVNGMTLMTTEIKTFDNQMIHVPNNKIWGDVITNITANATRRVDMVFGIGYDDDITRAREILARIVEANEKVLAEPAPTIRVHELGDSSVNFIVRPWSKTSDYWDVYWDVTEAVKRRFDEEGISIPFPQRDVHLIPTAPPEGQAAVEPVDRPAEQREEQTAS